MEEKLGTPRISVIMPVYNAGPYLGPAIDSILAQTFTDFEFLVFDDGSTDESADIIARYAKRDSRIRVFTSTENKGYVTHLNDGIHKARGTYIARMDADDISLSTRFAKQVAFLDRNPKVAVLGTSVHSMDKDGTLSKGWILNATPEETRVHFLFTNYILHPTVMMRASLIPQEGYREEYMPAEDFDLWTRILEKHDVCSLSEPLLSYRTHGSNISTLKLQALREHAEKILGRQITAIGIDASPQEISFHHEASDFRLEGIGVRDIDSWFIRLWEANRRSKRYQPEILLSTMVGRLIVASRMKKQSFTATVFRYIWMGRRYFLPFATLSARRLIRYSLRS